MHNTVWIITAIKVPVFVSAMYHCYLCQGQTTFNIFTMLAKKKRKTKNIYFLLNNFVHYNLKSFSWLYYDIVSMPYIKWWSFLLVFPVSIYDSDIINYSYSIIKKKFRYDGHQFHQCHKNKQLLLTSNHWKGRRGRDRMGVGFTTTYAIILCIII
jgi:hypothetical protein